MLTSMPAFDIFAACEAILAVRSVHTDQKHKL